MCEDWCNSWTTAQSRCAACSDCDEHTCHGSTTTATAVDNADDDAHGHAAAEQPSRTNAIEVALALNTRFVLGHATPELAKAGVLLHQWDAMDDGVTHSAWMPCGDGEWCWTFQDRVSASLVNKALPHVFDHARGGFVIRPHLAKINCAWAGDGATMDRTCSPPGLSASCTPGCFSSDTGHPMWCDDKKWPGNHRCPWQAGRLDQMVKQHMEDLSSGRREHETQCGQGSCKYNEVVLDADSWKLSLPSIIEAVFYPAASADDASRARRVHAELLEYFAGFFDAAPPPLLLLDLSDLDAPFQLPSGASREEVMPHFKPLPPPHVFHKLEKAVAFAADISGTDAEVSDVPYVLVVATTLGGIAFWLVVIRSCLTVVARRLGRWYSSVPNDL